MATIVATYDTKTKALAVTKDGSGISNVVGVFLGQSWDEKDEFRCEVVQSEMNEDDDTTTYTRLCAAEDGDLVRPTQPVAETAANDIAAYLAPADPKKKA